MTCSTNSFSLTLTGAIGESYGMILHALKKRIFILLVALAHAIVGAFFNLLIYRKLIPSLVETKKHYSYRLMRSQLG